MRLFTSSVLRSVSASTTSIINRTIIHRAAPLYLISQQRALSSSATALASTAGSGQGGRKEKDAAAKAKALKVKEKEQKLKEKEKLKKEKEKLKKDKEKAKLAAQKKKAVTKTKAAKVTKPRMTSRLQPPKAPQNSWSIFFTRYVAERKAAHDSARDGKFPSGSALAKDAAPLYRDISSSEKAELLRESEQQKAAYPSVLASWTASLTPEMIKEENAIRARRKKAGKSRKRPLRLEGEPTTPGSAYIMWTARVRKEQGVAGEILKGETNIFEQSKLLAQAWKNLPQEERDAAVQENKDAMAAYREAKAAFEAEHSQRTASA